MSLANVARGGRENAVEEFLFKLTIEKSVEFS